MGQTKMSTPPITINDVHFSRRRCAARGAGAGVGMAAGDAGGTGRAMRVMVCVRWFRRGFGMWSVRRVWVTAGLMSRLSGTMCVAVLMRVSWTGIIRRRRGFILGVIRSHRDRSADQPFDGSKVRHFITIAKGNGGAGSANAAGSADAVHVRFRLVRQIVIHHVRDIIHIDPARRDVGGDQHRGFALLEIFQGALAIVLGFVPVNRLSANSASVQLPHDAICAVLRSCEHDRAEHRQEVDQVRQ